MTRVFVIHNYNQDLDTSCVIGVADSVENAMKIVQQWFGEYRQIYYQATYKSRVECEFIIEHKILGDYTTTKSVITLEWFELNKA